MHVSTQFAFKTVLRVTRNYRSFKSFERCKACSDVGAGKFFLRADKKISSDKKISFVLNPLVAHESSEDKEKLSVQGKYSCV